MTNHALEAALPKRPLKNKAWFLTRIVFSFLLFLLLGGGLLAFAVLEQLPPLSLDQSLSDPANRIEVDSLSVSGECKEKMALLSDCKINVRYTVGGRSYSSVVKLAFAGTIDDKNEDLYAYVLKSDPTKVGISWGMERLTNRWIFFVGTVLFSVAFIVTALVIPIRLLAIRSEWLAMLKAPKPVAVRCLAAKKAKGALSVPVENEEGVKGKAKAITAKGDLFWLDESNMIFLAFQAGNTQYIAIKASGYPADLKADELEAMRQAYVNAKNAEHA